MFYIFHSKRIWLPAMASLLVGYVFLAASPIDVLPGDTRDEVASRLKKRRGIEGQQHRDWARSDVRKALAGRAAELCHPIRRHRSLRIKRAELDRNRIPIHESGSNAWALHVLRGRGKNASGARLFAG